MLSNLFGAEQRHINEQQQRALSEIARVLAAAVAGDTTQRASSTAMQGADPTICKHLNRLLE